MFSASVLLMIRTPSLPFDLSSDAAIFLFGSNLAAMYDVKTETLLACVWLFVLLHLVMDRGNRNCCWPSSSLIPFRVDHV